MKELSDFLKEFVTPKLKPLGFRKKGQLYRLDGDSGDVAFISFAPMRIDPCAVVFHVSCLFVPEPYWQFLNRQYMVAGVPEVNQSGALASYSLMPPDSAAHDPASWGVDRTRWAFGDRNRAEVGKVLGEALVAEVPRIRQLLVRENLLAAIQSPETPSIRRRGALQSELLLMVDDYPREKLQDLLSRIDEDHPFIELFTRWADMRRGLLP
ncbi:DUF4304 domain-containing protein [Streptomyces sp. TRM68367]|uniref:DUF4304 domain-containing protein n=1 Tax=Streptomyces sp. TRM68367 TaxID=2758415 RepID=UPI00165B408C|nr:DUF4304 domain-containing protein [Streptomyces sp. TRM68367]MBC9730906.1 hypothetical protein [Streptomyces sp. TRM68367]